MRTMRSALSSDDKQEIEELGPSLELEATMSATSLRSHRSIASNSSFASAGDNEVACITATMLTMDMQSTKQPSQPLQFQQPPPPPLPWTQLTALEEPNTSPALARLAPKLAHRERALQLGLPVTKESKELVKKIALGRFLSGQALEADIDGALADSLVDALVERRPRVETRGTCDAHADGHQTAVAAAAVQQPLLPPPPWTRPRWRSLPNEPDVGKGFPLPSPCSYPEKLSDVVYEN